MAVRDIEGEKEISKRKTERRTESEMIGRGAEAQLCGEPNRDDRQREREREKDITLSDI